MGRRPKESHDFRMEVVGERGEGEVDRCREWTRAWVDVVDVCCCDGGGDPRNGDGDGQGERWCPSPLDPLLRHRPKTPTTPAPLVAAPAPACAWLSISRVESFGNQVSTSHNLNPQSISTSQ